MKEFSFVPHPDFLARAKDFYAKYDSSWILGTGDQRFSRATLKEKKRICRFCNCDSSKVTFKNDAHLVSDFIGNTDLFSNFECDECNTRFGQFESDLANYIGISRSILGLNGHRKAPSFVAKKLSVKSRSFIGNNILILSKEDLLEYNSIEDRKSGKTTITYDKPSYVPINVYKALVKAALSILPEDEVRNNYTLGIHFLQGKFNISGAHIDGYKLPFQYNMPLHIMVFKKRCDEDLVPTHIIGFYFQNQIIYLPLPFHKHDIAGYKQEIKIPYPPPIFCIENPSINVTPFPFDADLSGLNKVSDDKETMTMIIDPEYLNSAYKYDPSNDSFSTGEYDSINAKYIIITKNGFVLNTDQVRELSEFIKMEEDKLSIQGL